MQRQVKPKLNEYVRFRFFLLLSKDRTGGGLCCKRLMANGRWNKKPPVKSAIRSIWDEVGPYRLRRETL